MPKYGFPSSDLLSFNLLYSHSRTDMPLLCLQLPEEARELEKELRQITKEKNEAARGQDFEKV